MIVVPPGSPVGHFETLPIAFADPRNCRAFVMGGTLVAAAVVVGWAVVVLPQTFEAPDATCTIQRRLLTVVVSTPPNDLGLELTGQLVVGGFDGAGTSPTTGSITAPLGEGSVTSCRRGCGPCAHPTLRHPTR